MGRPKIIVTDPPCPDCNADIEIIADPVTGGPMSRVLHEESCPAMNGVAGDLPDTRVVDMEITLGDDEGHSLTARLSLTGR